MITSAYGRMLFPTLIVIGLIFVSSAYAQQLQMSRLEFEVGVDYGVVAQFYSPCNLDNLHVRMDWGDSMVEELAISQPVPFPLPPGGSMELSLSLASRLSDTQHDLSPSVDLAESSLHQCHRRLRPLGTSQVQCTNLSTS